MFGWSFMTELASIPMCRTQTPKSSASQTPRPLYRRRGRRLLAGRHPGYRRSRLRGLSKDIREVQPFTIELLYGDHEGGQRTITRFGMIPRDAATAEKCGGFPPCRVTGTWIGQIRVSRILPLRRPGGAM